MAYVYYNSKLIRPVQSCSIVKETTRDGTGKPIGKVFNITMNLTLLSFAGSPRSDGTFWTIDNDPPEETVALESKFASIARKQEALRELFAQDGLVFEIQPLDGSLPISCNPRINSISFDPDIWVEKCNCVVSMQCDELYPEQEDSFTEYVSSVDESWSIETSEPEDELKPRTYRLTHSIGAIGKRFFLSDGTLEKEAWQQARDYVLPRLGFDNTIALSSGVNNLPTYYGGYNHTRSENIDEANGSYSVVENWIIASGSYLEDFTVQTTSDIGNSKKRVSIDGSVTGLEQRNSDLGLTTSKWTNALARFNNIEPLLYNRAQSYSGLTLNGTPVSKTTGRNPVQGTISYSYEYDNRLENFVSGTISEVVQITNNFDTDLFAVIPILGRDLGSLVQDLESKQPIERTVNIELVFDAEYIPSGTSYQAKLNSYNPRLHSPQSTQIASILSAATPVGNMLNNVGDLCTDSLISSKQETWSPNDLRYSLNITYLAE